MRGHDGRVTVNGEEHETLQGKRCDAVGIAAIGPKCEYALALMANGRSRTCNRVHMYDILEPALAQQILHLHENVGPVEPAGKRGPVEAIEIHGVAMALHPRWN